jgi:hypothetical protein
MVNGEYRMTGISSRHVVPCMQHRKLNIKDVNPSKKKLNKD